MTGAPVKTAEVESVLHQDDVLFTGRVTYGHRRLADCRRQ